jgi:hypothetical protein
VAALQVELESRGRELDELTAMLIEAKVAAAQQGSEMLERKHEVRSKWRTPNRRPTTHHHRHLRQVVQLTTKLEVVEMDDFSAQASSK